MKKKLFVIISILVVLIYTVCIFLIKFPDNSETESKRNLEIVNKVKTEFLSEYKEKYPNDESSNFTLLGQYGNGYIFADFYISVLLNYTDFIPRTINIGDVDITHFTFTRFYYFEEDLIIKDLEKIYNGNYINKNDLEHLKMRFEEWKEYNYWIQTDYIVDYVLDSKDSDLE